MTRGKWVAVVVGLAIIAVLLPLLPGAWRAVGYVVKREKSAFTTRGAKEVLLDDYVLVRRPRFFWISGHDIVVLCGPCAEEHHHKCLGTVWVETKLVKLQPPIIEEHRCICPHPSHAQESE